MLAKFFSIGDRNYLNNAVVIADVIDFIDNSFGSVKNFKIHFKKPFLSQGEFKVGVDKLDGYIVGQFDAKETRFYFSYNPTDIELENKTVSGNDVYSDLTSFNVCYHITDRCRGAIEEGFEKIYGPMSPKDKVIFVIFEITDTAIFSSIIKNKSIDDIHIGAAESTGDRRLRLPVYVRNELLGYRYSTVKEFIV